MIQLLLCDLIHHFQVARPSFRCSFFFVGLVALSSALSLSNPSDSRSSSSTPPLESVPAWAKQAVWYQIFPERFRNGDTSNDPTVDDIKGSWPHETPKEWHVSSWTGDWYELQPWEVANDKGFYYHAQQRRYGGDLQGVLDKLDYLADLGVNALYFNPVFESPSLHKYDASMYRHIDNNFGPDPEGDRAIWAAEDPADPRTWKWTSADKLFLKLINEAHNRNIRIIIDGVFNHIGMTHWAFLDVRKNGERSPYKQWFTIRRWDDPATAEDEFDYVGWNGVKELPELREDENGLVAGPREHVHHIVRRWMDPNGNGDPSDGIDGWRLDVAEKVEIPFWREFRAWVREINPEAYIVGEVWWEDWNALKMFNAAPWLGGDVFDAVMNYRWAREVDHFFKDVKSKITASELDERLKTIRSDYRSDVNYVLMNLMDSHDTDRLGSQIVNIDALYDNNVGVNSNRDYKVRKPNAKELRTQKLIAMFQMTCLGAPTIYYGDEVGMWGADDPDDRKPMLWDDMVYENESHHPFGRTRPTDENKFNADLLDYYKQLIEIRRSQAALSIGDLTTLMTDDDKDVYAFLRSHEGQYVATILNNSDVIQDVTIPLASGLSSLVWKTLFELGASQLSVSSLRVKLSPKSGILLRATGQ
jgi:glycosidase